MAEPIQLRQDALVDRIKARGGALGNMLQLQGFLEQTDSPERWILHAPDFSSNMVLKREDIIEVHQHDNAASPSTLWVRPSAMSDQNDFLRGAIAGMATGMATGRPLLPFPTFPPTTIFFPTFPPTTIWTLFPPGPPLSLLFCPR